jgi:hypothetical protein
MHVFTSHSEWQFIVKYRQLDNPHLTNTFLINTIIIRGQKEERRNFFIKNSRSRVIRTRASCITAFGTNHYAVQCLIVLFEINIDLR